MREIRQSGSEGGGDSVSPYPYHELLGWIKGKSWVTGPSPVMTQEGNVAAPNARHRSNLVQLFLRVALEHDHAERNVQSV